MIRVGDLTVTTSTNATKYLFQEHIAYIQIVCISTQMGQNLTRGVGCAAVFPSTVKMETAKRGHSIFGRNKSNYYSPYRNTVNKK